MARFFGTGAIALTLLSCTPAVGQDDTVRLEFLSWWTAPGEKDARDELIRVNAERHPDVTVTPLEAERAADAYRTLDSLLAYRIPPATFQANAGSALLSRVILDRDTEPGGVEDSRLEALDTLFAEAAEAPWPEVLDAVSVQGHPYGVPVDLHRINNLYFNVEKLGGRSLPDNLEGFLTLVGELSAARSGPAFAIGTRDYWTVETLTFENLLPSLTADTPGFFEAFWRGDLPPTVDATRATLDRTLEALQRLWVHTEAIGTPEASDERGMWFEAFDAMMDPTSPVVFASAGDWANGYLEAKGFHEGGDFDDVPFPGTEGVFIFTSDVFPLPLGTEHRPETLDLLATLLSGDAQAAFNRKKGGIPAFDINDASAAAISPTTLKRVQAFRDSPRKMLAMSGVVTPDLPETLLRDALRAMLVEPLPRTGRDIVLFTLTNNYWMLKTWSDARAFAEQAGQ